jgi:hypothetical protein
MAPQPLDHIFPGSWIGANFEVWIGAEEDNQAWTQLLRARATYDAAGGVPEERRRMAFEELLIAEGSDWCWWYGPEHDSVNRAEFDQLYRDHLANVYRFLNMSPPEELSRPILRAVAPDLCIDPSGPIHPVIDGEVTSYFEWLGAGVCRVDERSGAMHGARVAAREVQFGSDGKSFFLRVDFQPGAAAEIAGMEARLTFQPLNGAPPLPAAIRLTSGGASADPPLVCAFRHVLEAGVPLAALGVSEGGGLRFQLSLWKDSLPVDAIPRSGWLEIRSTNPADMAG